MENNFSEKETQKPKIESLDDIDFNSLSEKERNLIWLFGHKIKDRLAFANGYIYRIKVLKEYSRVEGEDEEGISESKIIDDEKEKERITNDYVKSILAAKQLFRDFLESVIDGRQPHPQIPLFSLERMKEAYEKSDFDWTNQEEMTKFGRWFFNKKSRDNFEFMHSKEGKLANLFSHKISERLSMAAVLNPVIKMIKEGRGRNVMIGGKLSELSKELESKNVEDVLKDKVEQVNANKQLFRDFLETVIDGRQPIPVSTTLTVEKIKEAYEKSDFDWTNQEELFKFSDWLFDKKNTENNSHKKEIQEPKRKSLEDHDYESLSEKDKKLAPIFYHKIVEKIQDALGYNGKIRGLKENGTIMRTGEDKRSVLVHIDSEIEKEKIIQDSEECILADKSLFRDFLETVIDGRQPVPKIGIFSQERIKEAYEKSDFDWMNQAELTKFSKWFFDRE